MHVQDLHELLHAAGRQLTYLRPEIQTLELQSPGQPQVHKGDLLEPATCRVGRHDLRGWEGM